MPTSQHIHNFASALKWGFNQPSSHRIRRLGENSPQRRGEEDSLFEFRRGNPVTEAAKSGALVPYVSHMPPRNPVSEAAKSGALVPYVSSMPQKNPVSEAAKSGALVALSDVSHMPPKKRLLAAAVSNHAAGNNSVNKSPASDGVKSKILIRFRGNSKDGKGSAADDTAAAADAVDQSSGGGGADCVAEELPTKTWNLRQRKPIKKGPNGNGSGSTKNGGAGGQAIKGLGPSRTRKGPDAKIAAENEKKKKFSVSLTKEEIEEDFLMMTGSKPNRRPKKRAKNVQTQLDNTFPGLWLASVTPGCYKVSDNRKKG